MRIRIIPQGTMATAESSNTQESKQIKEKVHQEIEESPYCVRAGKLVKVLHCKQNATCTAKITLNLFAVRRKKTAFATIAARKTFPTIWDTQFMTSTSTVEPLLNFIRHKKTSSRSHAVSQKNR